MVTVIRALFGTLSRAQLIRTKPPRPDRLDTMPPRKAALWTSTAHPELQALLGERELRVRRSGQQYFLDDLEPGYDRVFMRLTLELRHFGMVIGAASSCRCCRGRGGLQSRVSCAVPCCGGASGVTALSLTSILGTHLQVVLAQAWISPWSWRPRDGLQVSLTCTRASFMSRFSARSERSDRCERLSFVRQRVQESCTDRLPPAMTP